MSVVLDMVHTCWNAYIRVVVGLLPLGFVLLIFAESFGIGYNACIYKMV